MRILLDTHTLLWFFEGNTLLGHVARMAIEDNANECFVSHVSAWEVAIKLSQGKLKLQTSYDEIFPGAVSANSFTMLPPDLCHYRKLLDLPLHHRDPFDRLLIAQAMSENMKIVTCDPSFRAYGLSIIW